MIERIERRLAARVDVAGLAAFRILFGLLLFVGILRFVASGWIPRLYTEPRFQFKYWGFEWVTPWPEWGMYLHYGILAVLALFIAAGLFYRLSAALFFIGFTYTQLLDVTNYLNHHYLVSLISLLFVVLPLHGAWSIDAWRNPRLRAATAPTWALWLLRLQIAVVYVYAGLAKLTEDWLIHAQPLQIWLQARTETPLVGPLLDEPWVAHAASWASFLFDTTIVMWLSWRRTRPFAYVVLVGFHTLTHLWFNIGMFPFIMTLAALVFFPTDWPRKLGRLVGRNARADRAAPSDPSAANDAPQLAARAPSRWRAALAIALACHCLVQVLVPLRHYLYPGDVLWTEEGMRFAWKVMVREKHGSVTFHVHDPRRGKVVQVSPGRYLNPRQEREMAAQPDLILQLARHIADDLRSRGYGDVEVRAEARVSLNGRPARLLVDPSRDLARVRDGLAPKDWILPAPIEPAHTVARW